MAVSRLLTVLLLGSAILSCKPKADKDSSRSGFATVDNTTLQDVPALAEGDVVKSDSPIHKQLAEVVDLSPKDTFVVKEASKGEETPEGTEGTPEGEKNEEQHARIEQHYEGVPVFGAELALNGGETADVGGNIVGGLAEAELSTQPAVTADAAKANALRDASLLVADGAALEGSTPLLQILQNELKVDLVWTLRVTAGMAGASHSPHAWNYFVSAANGGVIKRTYDMQTITQGSGPGGLKPWKNALDLELVPKKKASDPQLYVMNTKTLATYDVKNVETVVVKPEQLGKGPLDGFKDPVMNDAHGNAEVVLNMLNQWFGRKSIARQSNRDFKIESLVHFGDQVVNAFWFPDEKRMVYGDSVPEFSKPFASGIDVVGHEIHHGFTSFHSDLFYDGESGGMNESFSDIAGISARFFRDGDGASFNLMDDILSQAQKDQGFTALRYMCDPKKDGDSLDHYADFEPTIDVHYSSGIMNKAFCRLARRFSSGTPIGAATAAGVKKAASIFYDANHYYWTKLSTFKQGCRGTLDAAARAKLSAADVGQVIASWTDVGVYCNNSFALEPATSPVVLQGVATKKLTLKRLAGFKGQVALKVEKAPPGVDVQLIPTIVKANEAITVSISVPASAASLEAPVRIRATSGTLIEEIRLDVKSFQPLVKAQPLAVNVDFAGSRYFFVDVPKNIKTLTLKVSGIVAEKHPEHGPEDGPETEPSPDPSPDPGPAPAPSPGPAPGSSMSGKQEIDPDAGGSNTIWVYAQAPEKTSMTLREVSLVPGTTDLLATIPKPKNGRWQFLLSNDYAGNAEFKVTVDWK